MRRAMKLGCYAAMSAMGCCFGELLSRLYHGCIELLTAILLCGLISISICMIGVLVRKVN